jgi:lysophospholipase L1-like esterase
MRTRINGLLIFTVLSAASCGNNVNPVTPVIVNSISGPFAAELTAFQQEDSQTPYPPGGVVFVGSSSIRFWDLQASFPGRQYLNRGFGGSQLSDAIEYVELLILYHAPSIVVVYAGDNDIAFGKSPTRVADDFRTLVGQVHARLPSTRILFLAIKPSLARIEWLDPMQTANALIADASRANDRLHYVDIHTPMLDTTGHPRARFLASDGLHLSPEGYALWTRQLLPLLP